MIVKNARTSEVMHLPYLVKAATLKKLKTIKVQGLHATRDL
jgi:hypothetical protein